MRGGIMWLLAACGRLGFGDPHATTDAAGADGGYLDAPAGSIAWVKTVVQQYNGMSGTTDTFPLTAAKAGDAVVMHVWCGNYPYVATNVMVTAPGWTFTPIGAVFGSATSGYWAASLAAIVPNTTSVLATVTWTATNPCMALNELGDEFTGNDPTGGSTTFDAHVELLGYGDCTTSLVTQHANDAVWAACSVVSVSGVGPGFVKGGDDGHGDWSEYRLTGDPASTTEGVQFATTPGMAGYVVTAITIKP